MNQYLTVRNRVPMTGLTNRRPVLESLDGRTLFASVPVIATAAASTGTYKLGTAEAVAGDRIKVSGPALDGSKLSLVRFSSGDVDIDVPVISSNSKQFIVAVPPGIDPSTGAVGGGSYRLYVSTAGGSQKRIKGTLTVDAPPKPKGKLGKATLTFLAQSYANMTEAENSLVKLAANAHAKKVVQNKYNAFLGGIQDEIDAVQQIASHGGSIQLSSPSSSITPTLNKSVLKSADKTFGRLLANGDFAIATPAKTTSKQSISTLSLKTLEAHSYGAFLDTFNTANTAVSIALGVANAVALGTGQLEALPAIEAIGTTAFVALTIAPALASVTVRAAEAFINAPDGEGFSAVANTNFTSELNFVAGNTSTYLADAFVGGFADGLGGPALKLVKGAVEPCLDLMDAGLDGFGNAVVDELVQGESTDGAKVDFTRYDSPTEVGQFENFDPATGGDDGGGDDGGGDNGSDKKVGYLSLSAFLSRGDIDDDTWAQYMASFNQHSDTIDESATSTGISYQITRMPTNDFDTDAANYVSAFASPWELLSGPTYSAS